MHSAISALQPSLRCSSAPCARDDTMPCTRSSAPTLAMGRSVPFRTCVLFWVRVHLQAFIASCGCPALGLASPTPAVEAVRHVRFCPLGRNTSGIDSFFRELLARDITDYRWTGHRFARPCSPLAPRLAPVRLPSAIAPDSRLRQPSPLFTSCGLPGFLPLPPCASPERTNLRYHVVGLAPDTGERQHGRSPRVTQPHWKGSVYST